MNPDVTYYVATSLDGFIATPDGGVEWLERFHELGEDHGYNAFLSTVDALLLGSCTYEFALAHPPWPSPGKPSWVFTSRSLEIMHPSITMIDATPLQVLSLLARRGVRHAWLMGGGRLAASFRAEGLISRYMIFVCPVILGEGIPLFASPDPGLEPLTLRASKPYPSGIVMLDYAPAKPFDPIGAPDLP